MSFFIKTDASFSDGGIYRHWLLREWNEDLPKALFIMLNPSTADGYIDDPTIRKCCGFARRWDLGGIVVVNLFDFRATSPKQLLRVTTPSSRENNNTLVHNINRANLLNWLVVAAWGNHGSHLDRDKAVLKLMRQRGVTPNSLGPLTKASQPQHPLYVPYDTKLKKM